MRASRALRRALPLILAAGAGFWFLTLPQALPPEALQGMVGDPVRGERIFDLGGCAACHAAPGAEGAERLVLSGGQRFPSPFGTFLAPNISPDPQAGIGSWRSIDLVNAMRFGTAPDGRHYYPAFPYTSYSRVPLAEIVDLKAYLDTLPPSPVASLPHEVGFPFSIRRGLGLWKRLFLRPDPLPGPDDLPELAARGRLLVTGLGHCAECHTARGPFGQLDTAAWMAGAPDPSGRGRIPPLRPGRGGLNWSAQDIEIYLKSGLTPEYDTASGSMVEVLEGTARLSDADRAAIAAYLKALPPL